MTTLLDAMLLAPLVGLHPDAPTVAHRVDLEGLPISDWGKAKWSTARCGASVKLVELSWRDLRTRGTPVTRCAECRVKKGGRA